jgi:hypothetical protein
MARRRLPSFAWWPDRSCLFADATGSKAIALFCGSAT